jgi:tRNA (guanine-N7-)-methyltransferase
LSKGKLQKFEEILSFSNVIQPAFEEAFSSNYHLKGKWNTKFFGNGKPVVLELGCGRGEYTVELAKRYPDKNFLGIDIKGARIWKGAKAALDLGLKNAGFLRTRIDFIENFFAADEILEIWLTFPDPQLKKDLKKLTSSRFLNRYRKLMISNGLIHLKTDSPEMFNYTKNLARFNGLAIEFETQDIHSRKYEDEDLYIKTYYEQLWLKESLSIHYIRFRLPDIEIEEPPDEI